MTRAITLRRLPARHAGVPLVSPCARLAWSRAVIAAQAVLGGLGVLAFFLGLVWLFAILEALQKPHPCESAPDPVAACRAVLR